VTRLPPLLQMVYFTDQTERPRSSGQGHASDGGNEARPAEDPLAGEADWNPAGRRLVPITIAAQDPEVRAADGSVLTGKVGVPLARAEPGPRTHRFHVINYDPERGRVGRPTHEYRDGRLEDRFDRALSDRDVADPAFLAQNVFAIAARTLERFESALGRRLQWGFGSHQLYLVPDAMREANAFYSHADNALLFGSFVADGTLVHTALSHDIVAHETSHAILDGLRPGFLEPGLPDQTAFHEALADIVALLSVFAVEGVVRHALDPDLAVSRLPSSSLTREALSDSVLFRLAEQMGRRLSANRLPALRESTWSNPPRDWANRPDWEEPHDRGEILVAAVLRSLLEIWYRRLEPLLSAEGVDRERVAEEGAKAADHLLTMVIRAIDYTPPCEFEFSDFLEAIVTADHEVVPDDRHGYRRTLVDAFATYGIARPKLRIVNLATHGPRPIYENFNYEALRNQREEIYRFLWENMALFELTTAYYTVVDNVESSMRVGPDGFVVREVVVTYTQLLEAPANEMRRLASQTGTGTLELPDGLDLATPIRIRGGGMVAFDQFGRPKYHLAKPLLAWDRQTRRLDYLVRRGRSDTNGRYGYAEGLPIGQRFAELHRPDRHRQERW
jgi:hypothetical protein